MTKHLKTHYDFIIAGAGLTGCTAARILAESGYKILIIEKRNHIGGNCYDYENEHGILIHKYGPHIFHTNLPEVWHFVNRFSKFNLYQHRVLSFAEGRFIPFPINTDTICDVFRVNISNTEVIPFLADEINKSVYNNPPRNFRDAIVSQVGERFYDLFYKNYTIKQWDRNPEDLSHEIASRIPVRNNRDSRYFTDKYQGIPVDGYANLFNNMVNHENISILLNQDYFEIKNILKAKTTIYTGELDKFFNFKYGELEYRTMHIELESFEQEFFQPAAVVNYPNDYDFTRITEFKYFNNKKSSYTTICYEYPKPKGEPFYIVIDKLNNEKKRLYLTEAEKLENNREVLFIGRLAEYKYYNMDQVINTVFDKIKSFLKNMK